MKTKNNRKDVQESTLNSVQVSIDELAIMVGKGFKESHTNLLNVEKGLKQEIQDVRTELKQDIQDVKAEISDLREDMNYRFDGISIKVPSRVSMAD